MAIIPTMNYILKDKEENEFSQKEWIDYAAKCGFSTMEMITPKLLENPDETDEIITYALNKGFEISLHSYYGSNNITHTDMEKQRESIMQAKRSIDLAAKYNFRVVTFHPGRKTDESESAEEKWEILLKNVAEIAAYAKEKKVKVGLENMEKRKNEIVFTIEDLNRFAKIGENNPYFGVTLDFAHFSSHGITSPDLKSLKLPIHNVHLSQGVDGRMHQPLDAKNGMVDVPEVVRILNEYNYDGFAVFEMRYNQLESRKLLEKYI